MDMGEVSLSFVHVNCPHHIEVHKHSIHFVNCQSVSLKLVWCTVMKIGALTDFNVYVKCSPTMAAFRNTSEQIKIFQPRASTTQIIDAYERFNLTDHVSACHTVTLKILSQIFDNDEMGNAQSRDVENQPWMTWNLIMEAEAFSTVQTWYPSEHRPW